MASETRARRGLLAAVFLGLTLSTIVGRYPVLSGDELARSILLDIRLPRIAAAFLLGAVLAASGHVFQMLFRNPLVDAGFLGVSAGAGFGASLAIVCFGGAAVLVQGLAAGCAFAGLGLSVLLARRIRTGDWVLRLILAGIAVSALFTAGTGILKYLADPLRQLPDITFWLLGGLWGITWHDVLQLLPVVIPSLTLLYLLRWRLNVLSLRDETAFSLSAAPGRERLLLLTCAVAACAVMVSRAGQIAWVGLIIPHIARRLAGSDARLSLPVSILLGGLFVLLCDDVARSMLSGEIPLGILTSLVGAAVFLILMTREGGAR